MLRTSLESKIIVFLPNIGFPVVWKVVHLHKNFILNLFSDETISISYPCHAGYEYYRH